MSGGKPRKSADPLYLLLREGGSEEFNRRSKAGETGDFRGCDFRGIVSLSRTGARALMQIDSTQVSLVELPSSIFSYLPPMPVPDACVISPDGTRAYTYMAATNTIHVYDLTTVSNGLAPEIGSGTPLTDPPGTGAAMTITPDGGTLILAGNAKVIITPHP